MQAYVWNAGAVAVGLVAVTTLAVAKVGMGTPDKADHKIETRATTSVRTMSLEPQGAWADEMDAGGPVLRSAGSDGMRVSFVVPPDRGTGPVRMRVQYMESSRDACWWYAIGDGLAGPDGTKAKQWMTGQWLLPKSETSADTIAVPAAADEGVHTATFTWPQRAEPGMFIQFGLTRNADSPEDTCGDVSVLGLQLRY